MLRWSRNRDDVLVLIHDVPGIPDKHVACVYAAGLGKILKPWKVVTNVLGVRQVVGMCASVSQAKALALSEVSKFLGFG